MEQKWARKMKQELLVPLPLSPLFHYHICMSSLSLPPPPSPPLCLMKSTTWLVAFLFSWTALHLKPVFCSTCFLSCSPSLLSCYNVNHIAYNDCCSMSYQSFRRWTPLVFFPRSFALCIRKAMTGDAFHIQPKARDSHIMLWRIREPPFFLCWPTCFSIHLWAFVDPITQWQPARLKVDI